MHGSIIRGDYNLVENAYRAVIDIKVDYAKKRGAKSKHKRAKDSAALYSPSAKESQLPLIFSDRDEAKEKIEIRNMIMSITKQKFYFYNISHTPEHLNDFVDSLSKKIEPKEQVGIAMVTEISNIEIRSKNVYKELNDEKNNFKKDFGESKEAISMLSLLRSSNISRKSPEAGL